MINLKICLLKVLKFSKKNNANNKKSIKIFVNKILHIKAINSKKQVVKQNIDEFKYEGDTRTSVAKEIENETEGDDDDGKIIDNRDDDDNDDDDSDVEIGDGDSGDNDDDDDDDDDGDGGDDDDNRANSVNVNGNVSNIKLLIGVT